MNTGALRAVQHQTVEILRKVLPAGPDVAVLDFPAHPNAGDTLIYLGQEQYLQQLGYRVRYLADYVDFDEALLRRRLPEGPILMQGGGNLGDRWAHTQAFRERVISRLHDRSIVQMPQSIEFRDPANAERARRVFGDHPDLVILIRDHQGVETARRLFPETRVEFCPDLALGFGEVQPSGPPTSDVVMLLRADSERAADHSQLAFPEHLSVSATDWHHEGARRAAWTLLTQPRRGTQRSPVRRALYPWNAASSKAMAHLNLSSARAILSEGRIVVTDRLHAAVLGALMGKPVVVMDNAYGKIRPIYDDYLSPLGRIQFATNAAEAAQRALKHFHAMD